MTYNAAVWGALACTLSALGAVLTFLAWQRRGAAALIRGTAWTLLPLAAWLTGTLRLLTEIVGDVTRWAAHLVFSPVVWLGIALFGVSVVLFGVSGALRRRAGTRTDRAQAPPVQGGQGGQVKGGVKGGAKGGAVGRGPGADALDDEVAAILRKHGIS